MKKIIEYFIAMFFISFNLLAAEVEGNVYIIQPKANYPDTTEECSSQCSKLRAGSSGQNVIFSSTKFCKCSIEVKIDIIKSPMLPRQLGP